MSKGFGVIKEIIPHTRDYEYERVCGASGTAFPEEFEIPRENTGTLKKSRHGWRLRSRSNSTDF